MYLIVLERERFVDSNYSCSLILKLEMRMCVIQKNCLLDEATPNLIQRPQLSAELELPTIGPLTLRLLVGPMIILYAILFFSICTGFGASELG